MKRGIRERRCGGKRGMNSSTMTANAVVMLGASGVDEVFFFGTRCHGKTKCFPSEQRSSHSDVRVKRKEGGR